MSITLFLQLLENLILKVEELYKIVCELEEEKYDWETKIRKQEFEVRLSFLLVIIHAHLSLLATAV